jgi:hypothetical protein
MPPEIYPQKEERRKPGYAPPLRLGGKPPNNPQDWLKRFAVVPTAHPQTALISLILRYLDKFSENTTIRPCS